VRTLVDNILEQVDILITKQLMRILQISSASSFGGGERYLVDLSNELQSRGHDLYAIVRPKSPLLDYLQLPADHIKQLPLRNALDAPSARALARFVKEHKIDVVHAHMARDYSLAAYAIRGNREAKLFVTRHVLFPLSRFHRRTLSRVTKIIAVSSAVGRQLRSQQLVSDEKVVVIPNGINVDRFASSCTDFDRTDFLQRKNLPANCLLISSIGELRTLKRHDDLIKAAAIVLRDFDNAHFVIAGVDTSPTEENLKELKDLAVELKVAGHIQFPGWLDDAEQLLCATDVFVSASETESFGLSIVEAMSAGTAVVATRTEGAQEIIEDQVTGLLVPIGDIGAIAQSIIELLGNGSRRKEMGERSREAARKRFSLTRMVDDIEKIYLSVP
jgi:glycosyltransferase involved in cell wall biosynthesis